MHRKNLSTSSSSHHSSPSLGRDISTSLNEYSAVDMLASVATSASSPRFYVPEHNDARNVLHNSNVRSSVQRSQVPTASLHSLDSLIPHSSMSAHRLKNGSYLSPSAVQSVSSAVFLPSIQTLHSDNPHQLVLGIPHRSEDHLFVSIFSFPYCPLFLQTRSFSPFFSFAFLSLVIFVSKLFPKRFFVATVAIIVLSFILFCIAICISFLWFSFRSDCF